ncbi:MAG: putative hydrolase of the superfamily [Actinomycetota bacterium]|jgi:epoxide hydrolase-like predicted phosphatase
MLPPTASRPRFSGITIDAVLFDFHGVLTDASPWDAFASAGGDADPKVVLELFVGDYGSDTDHPWHQLERGEITMAEFGLGLVQRASDAGIELDFTALRSYHAEMAAHPRMVETIATLRAEGYKTGLVTNNIREAGDDWRALVDLDALFDAVVDSCVVGMRKPDPRIFALALEQMGGVAPERAVFLDDHPANVEGANRAGVRGIVVNDVDDALDELHALLAEG